MIAIFSKQFSFTGKVSLKQFSTGRVNKHKSNKIKENSNTVRHLNNGTDHRHSKSCCDQSSPARRTNKLFNSVLFTVSGKCHKTPLRKGQHWFRKWLGAFQQQAITWANVDPDLIRHIASLGHNDLSIIKSSYVCRNIVKFLLLKFVSQVFHET